MRALLIVISLAWLACAPACVNHQMHPLIGEDPEVYLLLGEPAPQDPQTSAIAAARRLHQALVQRDVAVVWALLDVSTRALLTRAGETVDLGGRELVERSVLPSADGRLVTVSLTAILFGGELVKLQPVGDADGQGQIAATLQGGAQKTLAFVREEDGWKIQITALPNVE